MDDFERELKLGFLEEASQSVSDVEQCFLELETDPGNTDNLNKIFRLAHNLKGSSKAVGFDQFGAFTHEFETFILKVKNGELPGSPAVISLLLRSNDFVQFMIEGLKDNLEAQFNTEELLNDLKNFRPGSASPQQAVQASEPSSDEPSFQVSLKKAAPAPVAAAPTPAPAAAASQGIKPPYGGEYIPFNADVPDVTNYDLIRELTEQMHQNPIPEINSALDVPEYNGEDVGPEPTPAPVSASKSNAAPQEQKLATVSHISEAPRSSASSVSSATAAAVEAAKSLSNSNPAGAGGPPGATKNGVDESIRVSLSKVEALINFVGEMVILQSVMHEQLSEQSSLLMRKTVHQMGKVGKEIQDLSMGLRMIPVKSTFQKMQRIVRDTAQLLGKDVGIQLVGEETELDKTVLEKINDPLVHLVRNSVDHGIEPASLRVQRGKPAKGQVVLKSYHQSGKLVIEVKDDGGGLNAEVLRKKAIEKGILKPGTELSEADAYQLIFAPGFSTKEQVSEVSGRGVGMDVVRTNIKELGGEIIIQSELSKGTTFKIILPLTLAIIDSMVVCYGKNRFVMPLNHVFETLNPKESMLQQTTNIGDILLLRGENLPLYRLGDFFGLKSQSNATDMIAMVIRTGDKPFAVLVDDILGQYQVVVKQLGRELQNMVGVSGSTILGDGRPCLIIEPTDLLKRKTIIHTPLKIKNGEKAA